MLAETYEPPSEKRSRNMAAIKNRNTSPERYVRKILHSHGFRFRLHSLELPGSPDIVLRKYSTVVLVNGCFWHSHGCTRFQQPKRNSGYWEAKFKRNKERDRSVVEQLTADGWQISVIWECSIKEDTETLVSNLRRARDLLGGHSE